MIKIDYHHNYSPHTYSPAIIEMPDVYGKFKLKQDPFVDTYVARMNPIKITATDEELRYIWREFHNLPKVHYPDFFKGPISTVYRGDIMWFILDNIEIDWENEYRTYES